MVILRVANPPWIWSKCVHVHPTVAFCNKKAQNTCLTFSINCKQIVNRRSCAILQRIGRILHMFTSKPGHIQYRYL